MKILVITGIFPPDIGGPATYVPAISGELVQRGHKVTVVTLSDIFNMMTIRIRSTYRESSDMLAVFEAQITRDRLSSRGKGTLGKAGDSE